MPLTISSQRGTGIRRWPRWEPEAGLFLGTVIIASIPGARWRLWSNGHPVVCLTTGRDLDVVAMANDRVSKGAPLLADVYADAAADDPR
jgi:hypothetical protein